MKLALPSTLYGQVMNGRWDSLIFGVEKLIDGETFQVGVFAHDSFDRADLQISKLFRKNGRFMLPAFAAGAADEKIRSYHASHVELPYFARKSADPLDPWTLFDYSRSVAPRGVGLPVLTAVVIPPEREQIAQEIRDWFEKQYSFRPFRP